MSAHGYPGKGETAHLLETSPSPGQLVCPLGIKERRDQLLVREIDQLGI